MKQFKKIDLYVRRTSGEWRYCCSTTWSKTCREACERFAATRIDVRLSDIKANFSRPKK